MKRFAIASYVGIICVSTILALSFVGYVAVKSMPNAKTQVVQEMTPAAEKQYATAKGDSFTAGKAFGEKRGSLDTIEVMVGRGKNYLLTQVNNRLKQLGPFRTRIENTATLSDSERKSLVAELNTEIGMFEAFKSEINRCATKEDIKNVADKIKAEWIKSRLSVASAEGKIVAARQNQLIADSDATTLGIQKRIAVLKASGKNTKAHEELLSAYGNKIASAKQDVASAQEKIDAAANASTEAEKQQLMKGKELLLMSGRDSIIGAYKTVANEARQEFSQRFK